MKKGKKRTEGNERKIIRVEKEKRKGLTSLLNFISLPLKAGVQFFNTVFKNPAIYTCIICFDVHQQRKDNAPIAVKKQII